LRISLYRILCQSNRNYSEAHILRCDNNKQLAAIFLRK